MESEIRGSYASLYLDEFQALAAARALFAEVYDLLRARGHEVEVAFGGEGVPQLSSYDGMKVRSEGYRPLLKFSYTADSVPYAYGGRPNSYFLQVEFDPGYVSDKVSRAGDGVKLQRVVRDRKRTPNQMEPTSIASFLEKYLGRMAKVDAAQQAETKRYEEERARFARRDKLAVELRARPNAGQAYVFGSRESALPGELVVQLRCADREEAERALAALDDLFPKR